MHPLDSLVAKVSLYDTIDLRLRDDGLTRLTCRGIDCGPDEQNLALRAARRFARALTDPPPGADIDLEKIIPPGKGLGGGSSDAAAVLYALNRLWRAGLDDEALAELGAELGSDVPLFLGPPCSRMTGHGERIEPLAVQAFLAVLHTGDLSCSTADVYRAFDALAAGKANESDSLSARQLDATVPAASPPSAWRHLLRNNLTAAAERVCPALGEVRRALAEASGLDACMSGSGSALFILCDDRTEAVGVLRRLGDPLSRQCVVVRNNPW
jgi:4-diphosphocytidyl-2-C-methyl-D-erythritol kinase